MKKSTSLLLTIIFLIGILPTIDIPTAFATDTSKSTITQDSSALWEWEAYGDGVQLAEYKGTQTDVYVPSIVEKDGEDYSVLKLGDNLFANNTSLNSATLGEGITEIGESTFEGATNLVCIVTPESLTTVGANAFYGCTSFNSVILYDAVTAIGENAFSSCEKLTIWCNESSSAHTYASENSIEFEILNPDAEPEIVTADGIEYYIFNGEAVAISFDNMSTDVTVPSMIAEHPVTSIKNIFEKSDITSVTLPNTLTKLEESAFTSCKNLSQISIPESITSFGTGVFSSCSSLTSFVIPQGVKSIPMDMFSGCTALKSVTIPNSVTKICQYAFMGCRNLTEITIPENITKIWYSAFLWCTRLNKVYWNAINIEDFDSDDDVFRDAGSSGSGMDIVFGDKVERIPAYAFDGSLDININSITFSSSITSVGNSAFPCEIQNVYINDLTAWCNIAFGNLTSNPVYYAKNVYLNGETPCDIIIPDTITKLNDFTFYKWTSLESITLPEGLVSIGEQTFSNCYSLKEITLPGSVTSIGNNAFSVCRSLSEINLPNSITQLGSGVFANCSGITSVRFSDNITEIPNLFLAGCSGITDITLPSTIIKIGAYAFRGCNFANIKLTDSITSIGVGAFYACTGLTDIDIPEGVVQIANKTFYNCTSLENVTLPTSITSIGSEAFCGCTLLEYVVIPEYVDNLVVDSFSSETILGVYEDTYAHTFATDNNLLYYVTTGTDKPTLSILNGVTYLITNTEAIAMRFDNSVTDIVIPDDVNDYPVTDIRTIFENSNIESISLPETIIKIHSNAFYNCNKLSSVNLPKSIKDIGTAAFYNCTSLQEVIIPESISIIADNTFYMCSALNTITIPESVTIIGNYAFYGCEALESVIIPENLTTISLTSFPSDVILGVYEDTYAHTFATDNNLLYYITTGTDKPTLSILDGITYLITSTEALVISFDGTATDIIIPSYVDGLPVTSVQTTFKGSGITSIVLPDTITEICKAAFDQCNSLTSITLPDSITSIGNYAFRGCSALDDITIPETVTHIGDYGFAYCTALKSITIPKNVTYVGSQAFSDCKGLEEIIWKAIQVSNTSASVFTYAGANSGSIKVTIASEVKSLPAGIFAGSNSSNTAPRTTSISIPDSLTSIGDDAFKFNIYLKDLYIESIENWCAISFGNYMSNPMSYADNLYLNDKQVSQITIPSTVSSISKYAFYYTSLNGITISEGVRSIGAQAFYHADIKNITIPESVTSIGSSAFSYASVETVNIMGSPTLLKNYASGGIFTYCSDLKTVNIFGNISIVDYTFRYCPNITSVNIFGNIKSVGLYAFADSNKIKTLRMPASVNSMSTSAFPITTILIVDENSYAHNFAVNNNLLYFVLRETNNPEISYGAGISGTATYTDGSAATDATVEILYDDGTVKETVTVDSAGAYSFTYAEVGRYTIRVTDDDGNTASEVVSVERMNVFDIFLSGDTDLILKKGYTVSGTVSAQDATVTLTDATGSVIDSIETTDGAYAFTNVPNGTYIIKVETESGTAVKEIVVFNEDLCLEQITVLTQAATITGYVEVEDRDLNHYKKNWVDVTIYNEEGIAVDSQKTDLDGIYTFANLPLGEYSIVAEAHEMRPDKKKHFERSHKLTGYVYVDVTEAKTYDEVNIVLYEENDSIATISGKVTVNGETQGCEVVLRNVFKYEVAKLKTGQNGKYSFTNIPDGLYFITAITSGDGMGFTVVVVRNGKVYGNTDITVSKPQKFYDREKKMHEDIPHCDNRDDALKYKDRIAEEKRYYDSLSEKEKHHCSKEYVERLERLCKWIADSSYTSKGDIEGIIENEGTIISGDEIESEEKIEFVLNISEADEHIIPDDGLHTREDYIQQSINDTARGNQIARYYDITLTKNGKEITNVSKHTDTTGKLRITIEIPEEYRGHKHYSFVHEHKGESVTLVDLDDDPNTVTFEIDRFSTFALAYSDVELTQAAADDTVIAYDESTCQISVSSVDAGTLYIATYDGTQMSEVAIYPIAAGTADAKYAFTKNQAAFIWDEHLVPLTSKFTIE